VCAVVVGSRRQLCATSSPRHGVEPAVCCGRCHGVMVVLSVCDVVVGGGQLTTVVRGGGHGQQW